MKSSASVPPYMAGENVFAVCVCEFRPPDPSDSLLCNNYSSRAGNGNTLFLEPLSEDSTSARSLPSFTDLPEEQRRQFDAALLASDRHTVSSLQTLPYCERLSQL